MLLRSASTAILYGYAGSQATMTDPSIPLPSLPSRVSPGRAYFQCRNKVQQSRQASKGKGKQRAYDGSGDEELSSLPYDAIYAGIKDSPLFKKLQPENGNRLPEIQTRAYYAQTPFKCDSNASAVEELAWCGSTLIWSKGSSIYRKYSFSEDPNDKQTIEQALFAYFDVSSKPDPLLNSKDDSSALSSPSATQELAHNETSTASSPQDDSLFGPFHSNTPLPPWSEDNTTASASQEAASTLTSTRKVRVLVILQSECILLYYPDGQKHIVPCVCKVEKLWAMERGVLLERHNVARAPLPNWWPSTSSLNGSEHLVSEPKLYALLDPHEEVRPVSKVSSLFDIPASYPPEPSRPGQRPQVSSAGQISAFCEQDELIIYLSDRQDMSEPIIVTLNALTSKMSIWSYANVVKSPLDEVNAFRSAARGEVLQEVDVRNNVSQFRAGVRPAYHPTLGKRRRSVDGQHILQLSSEPEIPASTTDGNSSHQISGATAVSRRVSSLLERRRSQHNPDSTVADLLGSTVPADQRSSYTNGHKHVKAQRRTSVLQTATSSSMDRRTSTTRNELSVTLDRMAIGASLMPSNSQTSQPTSSQHSAATMADPGQMAAQDRQERFEALVGHGELERETSVTGFAQHHEEASSDILISRLHSLDLIGIR